ncbi:MAG: PAS domain S-box protein, partial [Desulfuromonadales bacterium]|nr:PAS domain S-box protein [Desulfuromonadales bacterium]
MKFPASFKQSLTLHFVFVAVLPILLLGLFGIQYFKQKHLETTFSLLDAHALDVSHEATEFLQYTSASLDLVEKTLNSSLLRNDAEINQYLQLAINELSNFESIYLLDKQHRITHLGLSQGKEGHRQDYLGLDLSAHEIFINQAQLPSYTWSDTFLSTMTVESSITLGIPLQNGTLLGTVSLKKLSAELIERLEHSGEDFQFSLLDHHGVLIADSRPGLTSQRHNLRLHPEVRDALDNKIEVTGKLHEDSNLLESVRLVPITGWVAYASLPMQAAMQGVAPLRYLLITALTSAVCMGIVLAVWLSRRMLRPVLLLRDVVGGVAKGNYDQPLQTVHYEELEDLSGSFREMIASVKEREQSLKESESRFRTVFQTNPDAVLITRLSDGKNVSVNDNCLLLTGYTAEEMIGKSTLDLELWVNLAEHDKYLDLILEKGFVENFEMSLQTKAGRVRTGLASARTLLLNEEKCLLTVVRDITAMKQAEDRL